MTEKKELKIGLSSVFLIISLIVIIIMAFFLYKFYHNEQVTMNKIDELNTQATTLQNSNNKLQASIKDLTTNALSNSSTSKNTSTTPSYNTNFSSSVFSMLAKYSGNEMEADPVIEIPLWGYSIGHMITINSNHEAYYIGRTYTDNKKLTDNIVNAWYCPLGQDIEHNSCLVFLKSDGSVTYMRINYDNTSKISFENEKILKDINNITNILTVGGGAYGAILITEDGSAIQLNSLFELDDLTK